MKKLILAVTLLCAPMASDAQAARDGELGRRIQRLEDRAALKTLVDSFSILADRKDVRSQTLLFTEDATVESHSEGRPASSLRGRRQIGDAFGAYLANFETVYHLNGQQTIELRGDRATGTSYCFVVLIGTENGRKIRNTAGVIYSDEYIRRGDAWLFAKRVSRFTWRDREEMG